MHAKNSFWRKYRLAKYKRLRVGTPRTIYKIVRRQEIVSYCNHNGCVSFGMGDFCNASED